MGGDEIVAKWLGDIYSSYHTTTTTPQRFSASSKRFRNVKIFNYQAANTMNIGKFYSDSTEFLNNSHSVPLLGTIEFEYVDIYNLGFRSGSGACVAKLTGINQY